MKKKTEAQCKRIRDKIERTFSEYVWELTTSYTHCFVGGDDDKICCNEFKYFFPTNEFLFDMLHEIGHMKTDVKKDRMFESEYKATVWAIEHCDEFGVDYTKAIQEDYQRYIYWNYENAIRRHAKNMPTKESLRLKEGK